MNFKDSIHAILLQVSQVRATSVETYGEKNTIDHSLKMAEMFLENARENVRYEEEKV